MFFEPVKFDPEACCKTVGVEQSKRFVRCRTQYKSGATLTWVPISVCAELWGFLIPWHPRAAKNSPNKKKNDDWVVVKETQRSKTWWKQVSITNIPTEARLCFIRLSHLYILKHSVSLNQLSAVSDKISSLPMNSLHAQCFIYRVH